MFFTQDDYKKIQQWLIQNSVKDTEFNEAMSPLNGYETVALVQNGANVKFNIKELLEQLTLLGDLDFINITEAYNERMITLLEAVQLIPYKARKIGQVVTFINEEGKWVIYQYQGSNLSQWNIEDFWADLLQKLGGLDTLVDEEDLTIANKGDDKVIKFKDKSYNPEEFSGLGRVILRKNLVDIEDPENRTTKRVNLLTQNMVSKENTIYVIQYDFDLNGEEITIPEGCVLDFQGGSFTNGVLNSDITCTLTGREIGLKEGREFEEYNYRQLKLFLEHTKYNIDFEGKTYYVSDPEETHIFINRELCLTNGTIKSDNLSFIPESGSGFIFTNLDLISNNIFEKQTNTYAKDEYLISQIHLNPIIGYKRFVGNDKVTIYTDALINKIEITNCRFYRYEAVGIFYKDLDSSKVDFGIKSLNINNCTFNECFTPIYIGDAKYWNTCNICNNTATNIYACFIALQKTNEYLYAENNWNSSCSINIDSNFVRGKTTSINWYHCAFLIEHKDIYCNNNIIENFINIQERNTYHSGTAYEGYFSAHHLMFSNNTCRNIMSSRRHTGNYNDLPLLEGGCEIAKAKGTANQVYYNNTWSYDKEYLISQGCIEEDLEVTIFGFTEDINSCSFEENTVYAKDIKITIQNYGKKIKDFSISNNTLYSYMFNWIMIISKFWRGSKLSVVNNKFDSVIDSRVFFIIKPDHAADDNSFVIDVSDNIVNGGLGCYYAAASKETKLISYKFDRNDYKQYDLSKIYSGNLNPMLKSNEIEFYLHKEKDYVTSPPSFYYFKNDVEDYSLYKFKLLKGFNSIRLPGIGRMSINGVDSFKYEVYKLNIKINNVSYIYYIKINETGFYLYANDGSYKWLNTGAYTASYSNAVVTFDFALTSVDNDVRIIIREKNDISDYLYIDFEVQGVNIDELNNISIGGTEVRPTSPPIGFQFFDRNLSKPIWWTGTKWVDATGANV